MHSPIAPSPAAAEPHPGISFREFVALIASLMALNSLAIDIMLPALPDIGAAMAVLNENDSQKVLVAYLVGFGAAQLFYGPISDRYGRRPVLLGGLALYAVAGVFSIFANDMNHLLAARLVQGIGCAAPRVVAVSIVRDSYSGRQMGRVMSLVMMVFMVVPIFAPSIGQIILFVAPWRAIFLLLTLGGILMLIWCGARLPETLPAARRQPVTARSVLAAYLKTVTTRITLGYMCATGLIFGALFGFIASAQQIFVETFGVGAAFPAVFAVIGLAMSAASFVNASLVERIGLRPLSHWALVAFVAISLVQAVTAIWIAENLYAFTAMLALTLFIFGFIGPSFNAIAMEPLGDIAGTGSSVLGFVTTLAGAICGFFVGQNYDGTVVPLALGFATFGASALVIVFITEKGRLFQTTQPAPAAALPPAEAKTPRQTGV
ncbi:multidrug effflux MFS transporter [Stappia sp.]|uniref:multidrug effflux MFS transporter n=1 Tax=Stappia sp. TaxID=1870903 RepID=UPI003C7E0DE8